MRVWYLDYAYLDTQRLRSQHYEAHGLIACVLKGKRWGTITAQFEKSAQALLHCHAKCVQELEQRGTSSVHQTPVGLTKEQKKLHATQDFVVTTKMLVEDVLQLRQKWEREGYYFGTGRAELSQLEEALGINPGIRKEEAECRRVATVALVKENHDFFKSHKGRLGDKLELFAARPALEQGR